MALPEAKGTPVVLGARLASEANISDSPASKTRLAFQVGENDADLKAHVTDLVAQLNAEWSKMSDRLASVEKFESEFTSNTLPVIQASATSIEKMNTDMEEYVVNMKIAKTGVDDAYATAVKVWDELNLKVNVNDVKVLAGKCADMENHNQMINNEVENLKAKCVEFESQHDQSIASLKNFTESYAQYSEKTDAHIAKVTQEKFVEHTSRIDAVEANIVQMKAETTAFVKGSFNVLTAKVHEVSSSSGAQGSGGAAPAPSSNGAQGSSDAAPGAPGGDRGSAGAPSAPNAGGGITGPPGICEDCPAWGRIGKRRQDGWSCHCKHVDILRDDLNEVVHDLMTHGLTLKAVSDAVNDLTVQVKKNSETPKNPSAPQDSWNASGKDPWNPRGPKGGGDYGGPSDGNGGDGGGHADDLF
jgi:hypothetical protein